MQPKKIAYWALGMVSCMAVIASYFAYDLALNVQLEPWMVVFLTLFVVWNCAVIMATIVWQIKQARRAKTSNSPFGKRDSVE